MDFGLFVLWLLVWCGIGAVCYLFYRAQYRIEQSRYERSALHASDYWPR